MIVKSITFSKTYELLTAGGSVWQKIGLDGDVEEGENPYEAIDKAREIVEESHKKYLPTQGVMEIGSDASFAPPIPKKQSTRLSPDAEIRKQYAIAAANRDETTVNKLEEMYSFKIG